MVKGFSPELLKTKLMKLKCLCLALIFFSVQGISQVTYETNDPGLTPVPLGFLGWNDNSNENLDIRQNNLIRTRFSGENWPGYNTIPAINDINRIFIPLEGGVFQPYVFSILQLGEELNPIFQREWMSTGITIVAQGNDLLWSGIIHDPDNDGSQIGGNATFAWGHNAAGQFGPDNLRFLFISNFNSAATDGPGSDQGRETMRITQPHLRNNELFYLLRKYLSLTSTTIEVFS